MLSELFNFRSILLGAFPLSCLSFLSFLSFFSFSSFFFSCDRCLVDRRVFAKILHERTRVVTLASVIHNTFLVTFRVELDSREASDLKPLNFVGCTIHFCNDHVVHIL